MERICCEERTDEEGHEGRKGGETRGGVSRDEERVGGERKRYVLKREWTDEEVQDDIEGRF